MTRANPIYLDHAAATPLDPSVLAAMQPYFTEVYFNPSAQYTAARSVKQAVDAARTSVAHWLGARPSEVIFTAGGTESNNIAVHGIMRQYPGANMVTSAVEHDSVLEPAGQYEVRVAGVTEDGTCTVENLQACIDDKTVLISLQYANNEVGTVQPIRQVTTLAQEIRQARRKAGNDLPLLVHTDACQASPYLDIHVARLGVDLLTLNGSKMYGPKQTGVLYVKGGTVLKPIVLGGGQESGLRSGTENVAGCIGLAAALELVQTRRHDEVRRLQELQHIFESALQEALPTAVVNGPHKRRLPNNVHVTFPGTDNERLMMQLDQRGILCAVGSACSASDDEPSHVLRAMGLDDAAAQASLRFSMGASTTEEDIRFVVATLRELAVTA